MQGIITAKEEFLFPDSKLGTLPNEFKIVSASNGMRGIQILVNSQSNTIKIELENDNFDFEINSMKTLHADFNTGKGEEQGGDMVWLPDEKPEYAVRKAPFDVYDCIIPSKDNVIETVNEVAAVYITVQPKKHCTAGTYNISLKIKDENNEHNCTIINKVYDVAIPDDTFPVTNWHGFDTIERFHNVKFGTQEYLEMLKKYIATMRRTHQTIFFFELNSHCVVSKNPYVFDFEPLTPAVKAFFDSGMKKMELGTILTRGDLPNGMPDMYTNNFTCTMAPDVFFETEEGYALTVNYLKELSAYLKKYGWEDKILFHIHDEPDVHVKDETTINDRRRQYYLAASLVRKYLPNVQIIEAVKSAQFYGAIDIWVPDTSGYEKAKEQFDNRIALGETVWNYVCCGPQGKWLNRFIDLPVIKGRLLFWGFAKNRIGGYLHWGFNRFPLGMNPFEKTSCPNRTGIGTSFPGGDSFIVLPGTDGPWITMRLEASRRGAEDAMLLELLKNKDEALHDAIVEKVFRTNTDYIQNVDDFELIYEELLQALSEK